MNSDLKRGFFENFEQYLSAVLMTVLVLCLGLQVFFRYTLNSSLTWTEELSRLCFVWIIYLGISLAAKQEQHVRVTAQFLLLPKKFRIYQWLIADIIWVGLNILFAVQGIELVHHAIKFPEITPSLGLSKFWIYAIIPAGFILMTLRIFQVYYRAIKNHTWRELAKTGGGE